MINSLLKIIEEGMPAGLFLFTFAFVIGIIFQFTRENEPLFYIYYCSILIILIISGILLFRITHALFTVSALILILGINIGFTIAAWRIHFVAAPKLHRAGAYSIEGQLHSISQSFSGATRYLIAPSKLTSRSHDISPDNLPHFIRVSFKNIETHHDIGSLLKIDAVLSPPTGLQDPSGYDFAFFAWFKKIGAVGYARAPPLLLEENKKCVLCTFNKFRHNISDHLQNRLSPQSSGFAAALVVGDRSKLNKEDVEALRETNLAHLLAISGLHIGLVAGFFFAMTRLILLLIYARNVHSLQIKFIAVVLSLIAVCFYLFLSGASVSAVRASLMVSFMLIAILFMRQALNLRAITLAAILILTLRPEMIFSAGFQMSFAATLALVAVFSEIRFWSYHEKRSIRLFRNLITLLLASFIAGSATAPFAVAHFNRLAHYGILANLCSTPIMGGIVIPSLSLGLILDPLGLSAPFYLLADWGIRWIVAVAHFISDFPHSSSIITAPPTWVILSFSLCAYLAIYTRAQLRFIFIGFALISLSFWTMSKRPDILIADNGRLIGILEGAMRGVNRERSHKFLARMWLENDGTDYNQPLAFEKWQSLEKAPPHWLILSSSKTKPKSYIPCEKGQLVLIINRTQRLKGECVWFDKTSLKAMKSTAIYRVKGGFDIITLSNKKRVWSP